MSDSPEEEEFEVPTSPEIQQKEKKIAGLSDTNQRMLESARSAGVMVDTGVPRVEAFIWFLVTQGIISYEQALDERIKWELNLRGTLQPVYERLKTVARMSGADMQTPSGLIVPGKGQSGG